MNEFKKTVSYKGYAAEILFDEEEGEYVAAVIISTNNYEYEIPLCAETREECEGIFHDFVDGVLHGENSEILKESTGEETGSSMGLYFIAAVFGLLLCLAVVFSIAGYYELRDLIFWGIFYFGFGIIVASLIWMAITAGKQLLCNTIKKHRENKKIEGAYDYDS